MRAKPFFTLLAVMLATFSVVSCEKQVEPKPEPEPEQPKPELKQPAVEVTIDDVTTNTITVTIVATNAESLAWLCVEGDTAIESERVLSEGETIDATQPKTITISELNPESTYTIAAVATNGDLSHLDSQAATTLAEEIPLPDVTVTLREGSVTENSLSFFVSSTEAEVLKWVCVEEGSRDVTAAQVLANGTEATANTESEVVVEGLKSNTAYAIYAAATCDIEDFEPVLAEKLVMTTAEPEPVGYHLSDTTTATADKRSSTLDNYFIIFADEANGYTLRCDFYTALESSHLPSGEYTLSDNAGEATLYKTFTTFMFTPTDSEMTPFESGSVRVEATPNEETREVVYSFEGLLYFANGDFVTLNYNGVVGGIELPEPAPVVPDVPEGATIFTPDPETRSPERLHTSSIEAGEYYLKFVDKNWNELVIDLTLDPTTCNDGNDALSAGRYTMADGTIDAYSYVTFYSPYFGEKFTEAELVVSVEGEEYELTFVGTAGSGSSAKVIYMYYKGEIANMVK